MRYSRHTMLPTKARTPAQQEADRRRWKQEREDRANARIAAAWAPDFPGQEKFGDDR